MAENMKDWALMYAGLGFAVFPLRARDAPAVEGAKQFLVNNMPEGRRLAQELYNLAAANKISDSALNRAKKELGIISEKTKTFPPKSIWILPGHEKNEPEPRQEDLDLQTG